MGVSNLLGSLVREGWRRKWECPICWGRLCRRGGKKWSDQFAGVVCVGGEVKNGVINLLGSFVWEGR